MKTATTPCPACGGSGQTSFFQGESRFLLTWEECAECCGTGLGLEEAPEPAAPTPTPATPETEAPAASSPPRGDDKR